MPRFKIQPTRVATGVQSPYFIMEIGENENIEQKAKEASSLCTRFPKHWVPSITKLRSLTPSTFKQRD